RTGHSNIYAVKTGGCVLGNCDFKVQQPGSSRRLDLRRHFLAVGSLYHHLHRKRTVRYSGIATAKKTTDVCRFAGPVGAALGRNESLVASPQEAAAGAGKFLAVHERIVEV